MDSSNEIMKNVELVCNFSVSSMELLISKLTANVIETVTVSSIHNKIYPQTNHKYCSLSFDIYLGGVCSTKSKSSTSSDKCAIFVDWKCVVFEFNKKRFLLLLNRV